MKRYVCIHGHFYQPARENPWLERLELQDSASPYHDWNQRVAAECYTPNAASRILDSKGNIVQIINNYARISFNFGPTLLAWMENHLVDTYEAILEADRSALLRFQGHGSAIAQVYNHMIMPMATIRDKITQVYWGIRDFEKRFGRLPEGMWLPETAVDQESLDILVDHGISFVVLAPSQAKAIRGLGTDTWTPVDEKSLDSRRPYLCRLDSNHSIAVFFYNGAISRAVAFEGLLNDGETFARRLVESFDTSERGQLVHIATDGESYGHHHRHGEMALSYALNRIETENFADLAVYGQFLSLFPPDQEVLLHENTAWSCFHGIERWRGHCGCASGKHPDWNQNWRKPLRESLSWLSSECANLYQTALEEIGIDPWKLRNEYITVLLDRSPENVDAFISGHLGKDLKVSDPLRIRLLRLLEMQRHAQMMFTSCGWFFDELTGIETLQVLRYAKRSIQLCKQLFSQDLEPEFLQRLATAKSNHKEYGDGASIYISLIAPDEVDETRVGAHVAMMSLFFDYPESFSIYCFDAAISRARTYNLGEQRLVAGLAKIASRITGASDTVSFAVAYLGNQNVMGGAKIFRPDDDVDGLFEEISNAFLRNQLPDFIRVMDRRFAEHSYTLQHLFKDEQRMVVDLLIGKSLDNASAQFKRMFETNQPLLGLLYDLKMPLPPVLRIIAGYIVNQGLYELLGDEYCDLTAVERLVEKAESLKIDLDKPTLAFRGVMKLEQFIERLRGNPDDFRILSQTVDLLSLFDRLNLKVDLWRAQNHYFFLCREERGAIETGDHTPEWIERFKTLGRLLKVGENC